MPVGGGIYSAGMTSLADPMQRSFDEVDQPLHDVTFVVVDLETTGGSSRADAITEIGAVKVRGGEVLGEFATLVNPGRPVPPQIVALTGITTAMVTSAPELAAALPSFLEFARGAVLVAHNAPFDIGFLRAGCVQLDIPWPKSAVVDTVRLARSTLSRAEAPSVRLGVLAPLLGARVSPDHRALHDARATVDVLHALFERLGPLGVVTLADLRTAERNVNPARRRKRHLADGLPSAPGVYLFRAADGSAAHGDVLYIGTSGNLRARVRSYFTAGETRRRIQQMVLLADRIDHVVCATRLEAHIREQRLIAAHQPRYNRRSRNPARVYWLRFTDEAFPRLSVTRQSPDDDEAYVGPFATMSRARSALAALHAAGGLRTCVDRLPRQAPPRTPTRPPRTPCALYDIGRCGAPCSGAETVAQYATHVQAVIDLFQGRSDALLGRLHNRMQQLSDAGRFAAAAEARDNLVSLIAALIRAHELASLATIAELVTAHPDGDGGWELSIVRYGRLAAAGVARRGVNPLDVVDVLTASAETVLPLPGPLKGATAEETSTILTYLQAPEVRLVRSTSGWALPATGPGPWQSFVTAATQARTSCTARSGDTIAAGRAAYS